MNPAVLSKDHHPKQLNNCKKKMEAYMFCKDEEV
jgi:hypothetical protein